MVKITEIRSVLIVEARCFLPSVVFCSCGVGWVCRAGLKFERILLLDKSDRGKFVRPIWIDFIKCALWLVFHQYITQVAVVSTAPSRALLHVASWCIALFACHLFVEDHHNPLDSFTATVIPYDNAIITIMDEWMAVNYCDAMDCSQSPLPSVQSWDLTTVRLLTTTEAAALHFSNSKGIAIALLEVQGASEYGAPAAIQWAY